MTFKNNQIINLAKVFLLYSIKQNNEILIVKESGCY